MTLKARYIEAMQAAIRLRHDRRAGRVTEAVYQAEMADMMAGIDALKARFEASRNGLSASQTKWMPAEQPASRYALAAE